MSKALYICAVCSQDFTRKWSGERHNKDLHFGMAEIVRVLDYIIGGLSGRYFPANPLECRTGRKYRRLVGFDYYCEPIEEGMEGQGEREFAPRRRFNRFKTDFSGLNYNGKSCDLFGATRNDNEFIKRSIYKNSEITREEKLDEIKTLLAILCPSASEWEIGYMVRAVSLQSDYCINDYWKWLRDSSHM